MVVDTKLKYEYTKVRWPGRKSKGIRRTRFSRSIYGFGIRNAYAVVAPGLASSRLAVYKLPTFKVAAKKTRGSTKGMYVLSMPVAMLTLLLTLPSIIFGKLIGWVKKLWTKLFSPQTSTSKKTGSPKPSTGRNGSKTISGWDKFFAYLALVLYMMLSIRPDIVPDKLSRLIIVGLASGLIIRRFR